MLLKTSSMRSALCMLAALNFVSQAKRKSGPQDPRGQTGIMEIKDSSLTPDTILSVTINFTSS